MVPRNNSVFKVFYELRVPFPYFSCIYIPASVSSHSSRFISRSYYYYHYCSVKLRVCQDRIHLAYVHFTLSYVLLLLCVYPKGNPLVSPRQGTCTGLRSVIHPLPAYVELKFTNTTLSLLHATTAHCLMFAVTLHLLKYSISSAFSSCFCDSSGVSDIPTK